MPKFNVHIRVGTDGVTQALTQWEIEEGSHVVLRSVASVTISEPPLTPVEVRALPA